MGLARPPLFTLRPLHSHYATMPFLLQRTVQQQPLTSFFNMAAVGTVNGVKVSRQSKRTLHPSRPFSSRTADDPSRVVTVAASEGKSGKETQISYTNLKVVGNGSFGVVFAAKMLGERDAVVSDGF